MHHAWPRDLRVSVVERVPVMLVRHGVSWELDSSGVLLPPLSRGVVADMPMLTGVDFARYRPGTQVMTERVRRALAWVRALGAPDLQLAGDLSEVDVADPRLTGLQRRGVQAGEVDLRFDDQVVVRPAGSAGATSAAPGDPRRRG